MSLRGINDLIITSYPAARAEEDESECEESIIISITEEGVWWQDEAAKEAEDAGEEYVEADDESEEEDEEDEAEEIEYVNEEDVPFDEVRSTATTFWLANIALLRACRANHTIHPASHCYLRSENCCCRTSTAPLGGLASFQSTVTGPSAWMPLSSLEFHA